MEKIYRAKSGANFGNDKAQVYGRRIEELTRATGGVTSRDVLEDARNARSPLHDYFEWDDSRASEKYRLHQAAHLVNHIEIEIVYGKRKEPETVRAFIIDSPENERQHYVCVERLGEKDLRERFLGSALKEAEDWMERYEKFVELSRIFSAIRTTKNKLLSAAR